MLEGGEDCGRTSKRIVERGVDLPVAGQRAYLPQQEVRLDAEAVVPGRRDGVIAEDEGPTSSARHRPQIIQPMKIPNTTAAPNITTVPKMSGT